MNVVRKKILIASEIAPRQIGSYERYHFGVVKALKARGWDVLSAFSGMVSDPVKDHFGIDDSDYVTKLGDASTGSSRDAWIDLFCRERPDVVWTHFFPTMGVFAYRIRRTLPQSWIVETDHVSRGKANRGLIRKVGHRVRVALSSGWLDAHIAVSHFIAERLATSDQVSREKIRVIYNGVDLNDFQISSTPHTGEYIITICYMRPEKGVAVLLRALALLKASGIEPRYLLVGDGPCVKEYRDFAKEAGLSKVEFLGLRNDVPDLLRNAMLSVVPSVWPEAFSLAAAESQAMGIPVIASAIGGLKEVIDDGVTGLHVTPNDPVSLAAAIGRLVADGGLRVAMGRAGRERVERHFNLHDKLEETVDFFEDIVTRPRSSRGKWLPMSRLP